MEEQKAFVEGAGDLGGTMRLGLYPAALKEGSVIREAYGEAEVKERHRHRYEVNNSYRADLEEAGLVFSGTSPDGTLVEFVELPREVAPVLRLDAGAPGVPLASEPRAPALRRARRGRAGAAARRSVSSRSSASGRCRPRGTRARRATAPTRSRPSRPRPPVRRGLTAGEPAPPRPARRPTSSRSGPQRAGARVVDPLRGHHLRRARATGSTSAQGGVVTRDLVTHPGAVAVLALRTVDGVDQTSC